MFMIRVCLVAVSLSARIFDLATVCARWVATRGWMLLGAACLSIAFPGLMPMPGGSGHAGIGLEERKLPDALQLGRLRAELRRLDHRGRHRDIRQPQGFR